MYKKAQIARTFSPSRLVAYRVCFDGAHQRTPFVLIETAYWRRAVINKSLIVHICTSIPDDYSATVYYAVVYTRISSRPIDRSDRIVYS